MKKRIVLAMLCMASISTLMIGCGKSDISKQYQNEYDMSKDEADEIAELRDELNDDKKTETLTNESFKLYDVSSEIKNSVITDRIVQINDSVIPNDGSITLSELYNTLSKYGNITISNSDNEITKDSLAKEASTSSYWIKDVSGNDICSITIVNEKKELIPCFDCKVINIESPMHSKNSINFFYPGNICDSQGVSKDEIKEMDEYKTRCKEYEPLNYSNVKEFIDSKGAKYAKLMKGLDLETTYYEFSTYSKEPVYQIEGEEPTYKGIRYSYYIDTNTSEVISISDSGFYNTINGIGSSVTDITVINDIDETIKNKIQESVINALTGSWSDLADSTATIEGYFVASGFSGDKIYAITHTDKGTYVEVAIDIEMLIDGSFEFNENRTQTGYTPYNSVDELLADFEMDSSEVLWN